jgi:hypothetical protein
MESQRRRLEEEKALAVVQEEDRAKARHRMMKNEDVEKRERELETQAKKEKERAKKECERLKPAEEKEESAPKPAEKPRHIHYRRYLGGRDDGERPLPFETRDVPLEEVKVGDVIVVSEAWECEDVDVVWKVVRLNKKTISVYACDETGTLTEKEKRLMDKRTAFRVVKAKWDGKIRM